MNMHDYLNTYTTEPEHGTIRDGMELLNALDALRLGEAPITHVWRTPHIFTRGGYVDARCVCIGLSWEFSHQRTGRSHIRSRSTIYNQLPVSRGAK